MGTGVSHDPEVGLMKFSHNEMPFPVKRGEIWPYLKIAGTCWYPTNSDGQGAGVIEGLYTDYIVDDLFAISYKYNQFK